MTQSLHPGAAPEAQWAEPCVGSWAEGCCGHQKTALLPLAQLGNKAFEQCWITAGLREHQTELMSAGTRMKSCASSTGDSYCGLLVMRCIYSSFHLSTDIVLIVIMNFNVWLVGCLPVQWHHSKMTENYAVLSGGTLCCFIKIFWGAFLFFLLFPLPFPQQERLSHIGPEEFVQAFVHKDPLDGTKVWFLHI